MEKLVETLIGRLEEKSSFYLSGLGCMSYGVKAISISEAKKIVNELAEEYKGRIIEFPCKLDDKVWWINSLGEIKTSEVNSIFIEKGIDGIVIETLVCNIYAKDIGKVVFVGELENTSQLNNERWFYCNHRLPDEADEYRVIVQDKKDCRKYSIERGYFSTKGCWDDVYTDDRMNFIAWQPLPAPYKEGCE